MRVTRFVGFCRGFFVFWEVTYYIAEWVDMKYWAGEEACQFSRRSGILLMLDTVFVLEVWPCTAYSDAVGEGAGCRVCLLPGSWFRFPPRPTKPSIPGLVPDLSGNDRTLTYPSYGLRNSLYRPNMYALKLPPLQSHSSSIEGVAHPRRFN